MAAFSYNPVNFIIYLFIFFLIICFYKGFYQIKLSWMQNFEKSYKKRKRQNNHDKNYKLVNIFLTLYSYALQSKGIDFNTTCGIL